MAWDFETDPAFQRELDWMDDFVREEIEPLDFRARAPERLLGPEPQQADPPAAGRGQAPRLWACHLGPDLGGQGYGQ